MLQLTCSRAFLASFDHSLQTFGINRKRAKRVRDLADEAYKFGAQPIQRSPSADLLSQTCSLSDGQEPLNSHLTDTPIPAFLHFAT